MKLITELVENVKTITEAREDGKKNVFIEGVFLQADITNRNGRCYPSEIMEKEVERYSNAFIKTNRALGELGHPDGPSINLDRVSHSIIELKQVGNDFIGKAKILETPMGNIARNLIESGVQLGVSTRGMGSLKEVNGVQVVQDDFFLATAADIVADPSAPNAFVDGIMEGVEWVWDNGVLKASQLEKAKKHINEAASKKDKKALEEAKLRVFNYFLTSKL